MASSQPSSPTPSTCQLETLAKLLRPKWTKYIPITPTPKQTAFLLLDHVREVFYGGAAGGGKAEPLDAIVITPFGERTMGEIQVGDQVSNPDGSVSTVVQTHDVGVKKTYTVEFADGRKCRVAEGHLWQASVDSEPDRIFTTERLIELMAEGRTVLVPLTEPVDFARTNDRGDHRIDPYLLGVLLADGSDRSDDRFVPTAYRYTSAEARAALLQGLMDANGRVDPRGHVEFRTLSRRLALDVQWLVRSMGGMATMHEGGDEKNNGMPAYSVQVQTKKNEELFYLPKMKARCKRVECDGRNDALRVKSITPAGEAVCKCITVDNPNGLYLTDEFIVTHNSVALLAAALQYVDQPEYSALLLRRTFAQLEKRGALLDMANDWLSNTDAHRIDGGRKWEFPSGATLEFGYIDCDKDKYNYQSAYYHYVGFDELTQFEEDWYRYLFSRTRRRKDDKTNIPIRVRSASNPGNIGHEWVRQRFIVERSPDRLFVPSKLDDNPYLDREEYKNAMREGLRAIDLAQLLDGNWDVRPGGGLFKHEWFGIVDDYPRSSIIVRYWDMAATADGDYTVGVKMAEHQGIYYVLDVKRFRATPHVVEQIIGQTAQEDGRNVYIYMEQEPGSAGVANIDNYARRVLNGYIFRADRKTGDKYTRALPLSAAAEHGNVKLLRAKWIGDYLDELDAFPDSTHDDQVDASSGAFNAIQQIRGGGVRMVGSLKNVTFTAAPVTMPTIRPRVII